jgi:hypothetical protein
MGRLVERAVLNTSRVFALSLPQSIPRFIKSSLALHKCSRKRSRGQVLPCRRTFDELSLVADSSTWIQGSRDKCSTDVLRSIRCFRLRERSTCFLVPTLAELIRCVVRLLSSGHGVYISQNGDTKTVKS